MTKYNIAVLDKEIQSCKTEIIMMVTLIQRIKEKMQITEATITHVKEYIAGLQKEIDGFAAEKESLIYAIKSLRTVSEMSEKECSAMEYRYIYGWTIQKISEFMNVSIQTINRYLRKGESAMR